MTDKPPQFEFAREHPAQDVADHEILLSFDNDDDAYRFRDWLHSEHAANAYQGWLAERGLL